MVTTRGKKHSQEPVVQQARMFLFTDHISKIFYLPYNLVGRKEYCNKK